MYFSFLLAGETIDKLKRSGAMKSDIIERWQIVLNAILASFSALKRRDVESLADEKL